MATLQIVNDSKTNDHIVNSHSIIASMSFFSQWTSEKLTEESKNEIMHKKEAAILSLIKNIIEYSETCKNNKTSYIDSEIANIFLIVSNKWIESVLPKNVDLGMEMVPDFSKIDYEHPLHIAMAHYCYSQGVLYSNRNSKVTCEVHTGFQDKYHKNSKINKLEHQEIAEMYSEFSYVKLLNLCFQRLLKDSLYGHNYSENSDVYQNAKELLDLSVINYNKVINDEVAKPFEEINTPISEINEAVEDVNKPLEEINKPVEEINELVEEVDHYESKSPVNSTEFEWATQNTHQNVVSDSVNTFIDRNIQLVVELKNDEKKNIMECNQNMVNSHEQTDDKFFCTVNSSPSDSVSREILPINDINESRQKDNHETNGPKNIFPYNQTDHQKDNQTTNQQYSELVHSTNDIATESINEDRTDNTFDENCDVSITITNSSNYNDITRDQNVLKILSYKSTIGIFIMEIISFIKNDSPYACDNMKTNLRHLLEWINTDDVLLKEACSVINTKKITSIVRDYVTKSDTPEKHADMMSLIDEIDSAVKHEIVN